MFKQKGLPQSMYLLVLLGLPIIKGVQQMHMCLPYWVNIIVNMKKRIAQKLHIIILLQLGLVTFRFHVGKNSKIGFDPGILESWNLGILKF